LLPPLVRKQTLIVVAHRLSTIQDSDSILLLNENHLVAVGSHRSLPESNDYYRSLVSCQQLMVGHEKENRKMAWMR
jgi:ATP-binding cassette subfamily B protein